VGGKVGVLGRARQQNAKLKKPKRVKEEEVNSPGEGVSAG